MANPVQSFLEDCLPELEDLRAKNIFTQTEIASIIKRRSHFENSCHRPTPQKEDFTRYIQYEMNLNRLRIKRKIRFGLHGKASASDHAAGQRIMRIFTRALRSYKNDIPLWMEYINFLSKRGSKKVINKVYAKLLMLFPAKPYLWIRAAVWESEHGDITATRDILMRALRTNKTSAKIWLAWFRIEMNYAQKLRKRRVVLGVDSENDVAQTNQATSAEDTKMPGEEEEKSKVDAFLKGVTAKFVFRNAISAISDDYSFLLEFLRSIPDENIFEPIKDAIYQSLERNFSHLAPCWEIIANRAVEKSRQTLNENKKSSTLKAEKCGLKVLEKAVSKLQTLEIWECYVSYLTVRLEHLQKTKKSKKATQFLRSRLFDVFQRAFDNSFTSMELFQKWTDALLEDDNTSEAYRIAEISTQKHKDSEKSWILLCELTLRRFADSDTSSGVPQSKSVLQKGLDSVSHERSFALWRYLLDTVTSSTGPHAANTDLQEIHKLFRKSALSRCKNVDSLMEMYIKWCSTSDPTSVLSVCDFIASQSPSLQFLQQIQELLTSLDRTPETRTKIIHIRERMVNEYGAEHPEVWLDYIRWAKDWDAGVEAHSILYWRALKSLNESQKAVFIENL